MTSHPKKQAFTLVELAIVLMVIGLIVGAIIVGSTLLGAANLQAIIANVDKYEKATLLFKEKYKEFPGDFTGATALWGTDTNCPATTTNSVLKTATCNGDGDGFIGGSSSTPLVISSQYETIRLWQHLSNAGFIDTKFTGATYNGVLSPGINAPLTKNNGGTFSLFYINNYTLASSPSVYTRDYKHVLVFGAPNTLLTNPPDLAALTAPDAVALDGKIDDGLPVSGRVLSYTTDASSPAPTCVTGTVYNTVRTSAKTALCSLIFVTGF